MFSSMESYQRNIRRETLSGGVKNFRSLTEAFGVWETQRPLCVEGKRVFIRHPFNWLTVFVVISSESFVTKPEAGLVNYIRLCFWEIFVLRAHVQRLSWRSDVALRKTIKVLQTHTNTNSVPLWIIRFFKDFIYYLIILQDFVFLWQ